MGDLPVAKELLEDWTLVDSRHVLLRYLVDQDLLYNAFAVYPATVDPQVRGPRIPPARAAQRPPPQPCCHYILMRSRYVAETCAMLVQDHRQYTPTVKLGQPQVGGEGKWVQLSL